MTEQGVFNPDINNLAKSFNDDIEKFNFYNGDAMPELEKTFIGQMVSTIPVSLFEALKLKNLKYVG